MPLVVILGMHRSGTSYVAQLLHAAGYNLGDDVLNHGESDNLAGHWESQTAIAINDQILDCSGGSWCEPPTKLVSNEATWECIDRFVDWMSRRRLSAFKDPRTTITFPVWRHRLRHYQLIACLRHPMAVARSLQVRQGWHLARGLALWVDYNRRLLDCLQQEPSALLFDFDADAAWIERWFENCCHHLDISSGVSAWQALNPFLRHHEATGPIPDPRARDLYDQLKSLTRARGEMGLPMESLSGNMIVPPSIMQEKVDRRMSEPDLTAGTEQVGQRSLKAAPRSAEDIADVYRLQDYVVQKLDRRFRNAEAEWSKQFQQQRADLHVLERWTHECHERLAEECAGERTRSEVAYRNLSQIADEHEAIVDQVDRLSCRCDQFEAAIASKTEQLSIMLNELSDQLTTCNQAFTAINQWLPLRMWRGIRKQINSVRRLLRRKEHQNPVHPNAATPAPHFVEHEALSSSDSRTPTSPH